MLNLGHKNQPESCFSFSYNRSCSLVAYYKKCLSRGPRIQYSFGRGPYSKCYSVMWGLVDTSCHLTLTMPLVMVATTHETVLCLLRSFLGCLYDYRLSWFIWSNVLSWPFPHFPAPLGLAHF